MIIQYDTRPDATIDEKIRSLSDSIMLAFNEAGFSTDHRMSSESAAQSKSIATMEAQIRQLNGLLSSMQTTLNDIATRLGNVETTVSGHTASLESLDQRVTALEQE